MGSIADKLLDALSMFWSALDERERMMLLYFGLYVSVSCLLALQQRSRERLKHELREEMTRGAAV